MLQSDGITAEVEVKSLFSYPQDANQQVVIPDAEACVMPQIIYGSVISLYTLRLAKQNQANLDL